MNQEIRAADHAVSRDPVDSASDTNAPISYIDEATARDLSDELAQRYSDLLNLLASR